MPGAGAVPARVQVAEAFTVAALWVAIAEGTAGGTRAGATRAVAAIPAALAAAVDTEPPDADLLHLPLDHGRGKAVAHPGTIRPVGTASREITPPQAGPAP